LRADESHAFESSALGPQDSSDGSHEP
jgi:hypothetical protein